jgi:hypothetical protein
MSSTLSLTQLENELFAEWRQGRVGFVTDGLVDELSFLASKPRVLFVLKEVNSHADAAWDLREFMKEGARAHTWDNICRWIEGIRRLPDEIPWSEMSLITEDRRKESLKSICAVNVKKKPGRNTADIVELRRHAAADREFLKRQLALYDPEITVCCGTYWFLHEIDILPSPTSWSETTRGVPWWSPSPGKHVISYAHPKARAAPHLLFYGLIDALREIRLGPRDLQP